ncbi:MAG: hypothetical protein P9L90_07220 [Candidatus Aadella gelida]|nr:hypothetical protein [Candidatus Aadella gelida]
MKNKDLFKYLFGCKSEILSENIIVVPFIEPERFMKGCNVLGSFSGKMYSGIKAEKSGREFCVIKCGIGSGQAGDAVILLKESKVKNLLFVGSCGGLGDLDIGDIILGENAYNGEGFSRYYNGKGSQIDLSDEKETPRGSDKYMGCLRDLLERKHEKYVKGKIYTTGSITAEEGSLLKRLENEGFSAVEMELSAIYTASKKIGVNASSLLFVSDLPLKKPIWEIRTSPQHKGKMLEGLKKVIDISVEFVVDDAKF